MQKSLLSISRKVNKNMAKITLNTTWGPYTRYSNKVVRTFQKWQCDSSSSFLLSFLSINSDWSNLRSLQNIKYSSITHSYQKEICTNLESPFRILDGRKKANWFSTLVWNHYKLVAVLSWKWDFGLRVCLTTFHWSMLHVFKMWLLRLEACVQIKYINFSVPPDINISLPSMSLHVKMLETNKESQIVQRRKSRL